MAPVMQKHATRRRIRFILVGNSNIPGKINLFFHKEQKNRIIFATKIKPSVMLTVRPTLLTDLPRLLEIFADARAFMAENGNASQWGDGYPHEDDIMNDIRRNVSYVVLDEDTVVGTFAFILGEDPTYRLIEGGTWINDPRTYGTIHRLAAARGVHGIADTCLHFCEQRTGHLRADTHSDNKVLQHFLTSRGFVYRGIIYVRNHSPRLAYQRI